MPPFYADLHIHSKYSRACSQDCDLEHLALVGRRKGISLIGTSVDSCHIQNLTQGGMVRTAIYTRLSLDPTGRGENTQLQERECRDYAEDQGWQVVQVFTDNDVSVSRYSKKLRPSYEKLLHLIRAGEVDAVLVTEMTRLYRRIEELLELLRLAEATPLQRIQTTDGSAYLLSTADGVHSAIASVNNAVLESRRISDRTRRKKKARAAEGRFNGGPRPFAYEADGVTVRESEAKVVRWCYERLLAGDSLRTLVRTLNEEGGHWHAHTLRQILTSKRIIGVRVHQGNGGCPDRRGSSVAVRC
jgi:site-specific DNA recombinase